MPIKILGIILVISSCTIWGFLKSRELSGREKSLINIKAALSMLESEIVFSSHYLKYAFEKISEICGCPTLFSDTAEQLGSISVAECWSMAIDKNKKALYLKDSDVQILKLLGAELGMSNREQQAKNLHHISSLLDGAISDAHSEYLSSSKLYRSMGLLTGLFLVILLL